MDSSYFSNVNYTKVYENAKSAYNNPYMNKAGQALLALLTGATAVKRLGYRRGNRFGGAGNERIIP